MPYLYREDFVEGCHTGTREVVWGEARSINAQLDHIDRAFYSANRLATGSIRVGPHGLRLLRTRKRAAGARRHPRQSVRRGAADFVLTHPRAAMCVQRWPCAKAACIRAISASSVEASATVSPRVSRTSSRRRWRRRWMATASVLRRQPSCCATRA